MMPQRHNIRLTTKKSLVEQADPKKQWFSLSEQTPSTMKWMIWYSRDKMSTSLFSSLWICSKYNQPDAALQAACFLSRPLFICAQIKDYEPTVRVMDRVRDNSVEVQEIRGRQRVNREPVSREWPQRLRWSHWATDCLLYTERDSETTQRDNIIYCHTSDVRPQSETDDLLQGVMKRAWFCLSRGDIFILGAEQTASYNHTTSKQ